VLQEITAQECTKYTINVIHMEREDWDVVSCLFNALFMPDLFIACVYSLFLLQTNICFIPDGLFSLQAKNKP
jgi:hypothetical protein